MKRTARLVALACAVVPAVWGVAVEQTFYRVLAQGNAELISVNPTAYEVDWFTYELGGTSVVQICGDLPLQNWTNREHTRQPTISYIFSSRTYPLSSRPVCTGQKASQLPGDDGDYEAGIAWPSPRFVLQGDGSSFLDLLTGLEWSRNANLFGMVGWTNALTNCAALTLNEKGDWRLPNVVELRSLIDYSRYDQASPVDCPVTNRPAGASRTWSSTTVAASPLFQAWSLMLYSGETWAAGKRDETWYACAVRGPDPSVGPLHALPRTGQQDSYGPFDDGVYQTGAPPPANRFVAGWEDYTNCVIDTLTGLMWLRNPDAVSRTVADAISYCENLDGSNGRGRFDDWRLPNVSELHSLADYSTNASGLPPGHPFIMPPGACWSSTDANHSDYKNFKVNLRSDGQVYPTTDETGYVWPVRGGR